jgi:hypothetical protein
LAAAIIALDKPEFLLFRGRAAFDQTRLSSNSVAGALISPVLATGLEQSTEAMWQEPG